MKCEGQIAYLTNGRDHPIAAALKYWINNSEKFAEFIYRNRAKIRKKCTTAKSFEDLEDIRFELEIPYLLLIDQRFEVEYEKQSKAIRRVPDFTVTFEDRIEFNIEVKRIRQPDLGRRFDEWMEDVVTTISMVPSDLGFSLDMTHVYGTPNFLTQIETKKEEIVRFIENTIRKQDVILRSGSSSEHLIPGLDEKCFLYLTKLKTRKEASLTSYHMSVEPLFYTQREPYKLADAIFEKLTQMVPGMMNLLVCSTTSTTHEREDLTDGIRSINSLMKKKDDGFFARKGFNGITDFLDHARYLSGVLFKGIWFNASHPPNLLWCNSKAECQIPEDLRAYLSTMSYGGKSN